MTMVIKLQYSIFCLRLRLGSPSDILQRDGRPIAHPPEDTISHGIQLCRRVELGNLARVNHTDPVVPYDGSQSI
jgi:hypothetical protein